MRNQRLKPISPTLLIAILLTLLAAFGAVLAEQRPGAPFAVLELFTSQGCSSCPPADQLLKEIAASADGKPIYALSFHVDYWNALGWTDPYSGKDASDRQRRYGAALDSGVYTPQLVVNGRVGLVGSRRDEVHAALARALKTPSTATLELKEPYRKGEGSALVSFSYRGVEPGTVLRLAVVDTSAENYVPSGENAGRTLSHTNVVRRFQTVSLGSRAQGTGQAEVVLTGGNELIGLLQHDSSMQIVAAARRTLTQRRSQ